MPTAADLTHTIVIEAMRRHGLPTEGLQAVFQATLINKLSYASPAWWGFTSADDRGRLRAFFRRCQRLGYSAYCLYVICTYADERLCPHHQQPPTSVAPSSTPSATTYANVHKATSFRCTHPASMTVTYWRECYIKILIDFTTFVDIRFIQITLSFYHWC